MDSNTKLREVIGKLTDALGDLEKDEDLNPEILRKAFGVLLGSIHTTILAVAKTPEERSEAVFAFKDTLERLCLSQNEAMEKMGYESKIEMGEEIKENVQHESH